MALIPLNTFKTKTTVLTTLKYNQAKCARDTSLIIDSIAFDLLHNGLTQTTFAGVQYWAQSSSKIPGEVFQTLSALEHAKQVSVKLVINQTVIPSTGNTEIQVKDLSNPGNTAGQERIKDEYDFIMNIIENGTAGVTDNIVSNGSLLTAGGLINTANLLYSNKAFLQAEVLAYINLKYNTYTYDKIKCARDTRLLIDSLAFDLMFNGSTQSTFAGLQYWSQGSITIPTEASQTVAALTYAKTIIGKIIQCETITKSTGNPLSQYIDETYIGSVASKTMADSLSTLIISVVSSGTEGVTDDIIPNGNATTEEGYLNAYDLLQNNKRFIQTEIISWINVQIANASGIWANFVYNADSCFRDMGYIVDCISFDLKYGGNRQSIQTGVYYYGFSSTTSAIPTEISETLSAYNYLRSIIGYVVESQQLPAILQTTVDQVLAIDTGTSVETTYVQENIDIIMNIIQDGPASSPVKKPIELTKTTDSNLLYAADLLLANRDFLAAEITAYVDTNTSTAFVYDQVACNRDVGYIVDSVVFDIKHGGNRQAAQSGVYYYNNSSTISIVPTEKPDTINAYNYMRSVISKVIQGQLTTNIVDFPAAPYQSEVKQNIVLPASTLTVSQTASGKITYLNTIINSGPSFAISSEIKPINLTSSTNADIIKAYNIIQANKPFITAEVIGFMDSLKTPNTIKLYTSPPGVTTIILMAQVANITDHNISITFAHYRNLPVIADPSTLNGFQEADTTTEIVKGFVIPPNDSASLIQGKMIIESFDSVIAYASESDGLKVILSILETANA